MIFYLMKVLDANLSEEKGALKEGPAHMKEDF
jgi:hypothetical protein